VTIVFRAAREHHEDRSPAQPGHTDDPRQKRGFTPEKRNFYSAGFVAFYRESVTANRHDLVAAERGNGTHGGHPVAPRLDIRALPIAHYAPTVREIPEPPCEG
jgi:hypothetical protein